MPPFVVSKPPVFRRNEKITLNQNSAFFPCTFFLEPVLKAPKSSPFCQAGIEHSPLQASPHKPPPASVASWDHTKNSSPAQPAALFWHKNPKVATQGEEEFKFQLPTWQYGDLPLSHQSCLRISL